MYYIIIREYQPNDMPQITEVVRKAYTSNVSNSFITALFNEVTFQAIVLLAAFMFIFVGFPLQYCLLSVPIVLIMIYILIYGSILMKSAELVHGKRALQTWVAEAYEPYFYSVNSKAETGTYRILTQDKIDDEGIDETKYRRKIIGTCSVMRHNLSDEWAWLFRLAVDENYRRKGLGLLLTQAAQNWCKNNRINYLELVITECQGEARQVFTNAGFTVKQLYHKRLLTSAVSIQMFQLRCEIRPTFSPH